MGLVSDPKPAPPLDRHTLAEVRRAAVHLVRAIDRALVAPVKTDAPATNSAPPLDTGDK